MAVPTVLTDLSTTAANNSPSGSETVGSSLDDYLRGIQAVLRAGLAHKGADIASATTTDLGAVVGLMHDITGTTTITGFGTVSAGVWKIVKFEGALTLTHNATSLILPGAANITTQDGDIGVFISEGSGNWRCVTYLSIATQALMEAAAALHAVVTPARQHFHPGHPKCWAKVTVSGGTPTLASNYNITSITDTATGRLTVTIATDFSGTDWCCIPSVEGNGTVTGSYAVAIDNGTQAAGSVVLESWLAVPSSGGTENVLTDPAAWHMVGLGDQ